MPRTRSLAWSELRIGLLTMTAIVIAAVLVFTVASFFFALAESALFSLGKWRARQLAERQPGPGAVVVQLLNQPQQLPATISLCNTFTNPPLVGAGPGATRVPVRGAARAGGARALAERVSPGFEGGELCGPAVASGPTTERTGMSRPPRCFSIGRIAACASRNVAVRLVASTASQSSRFIRISS